MQLSEKHPEELREDVLEHVKTDFEYGPTRARKTLATTRDLHTILENQESGKKKHEGHVPCEGGILSRTMFFHLTQYFDNMENAIDSYFSSCQ